jgi:hypothetical protein
MCLITAIKSDDNDDDDNNNNNTATIADARSNYHRHENYRITRHTTARSQDPETHRTAKSTEQWYPRLYEHVFVFRHKNSMEHGLLCLQSNAVPRKQPIKPWRTMIYNKRYNVYFSCETCSFVSICFLLIIQEKTTKV